MGPDKEEPGSLPTSSPGKLSPFPQDGFALPCASPYPIRHIPGESPMLDGRRGLRPPEWRDGGRAWGWHMHAHFPPTPSSQSGWGGDPGGGVSGAVGGPFLACETGSWLPWVGSGVGRWPVTRTWPGTARSGCGC